MSGVTKHIFDQEVRDILSMWDCENCISGRSKSGRSKLGRNGDGKGVIAPSVRDSDELE